MTIYVVVNRFGKMAHFIPCKSTNDASSIDSLFIKEIVRIHDLPQSIISDRDIKFVGHFWRTLWKRLGTNLNFNFAYNPQTNAQIEVVNKLIGNLLKCLTKQYADKWDLVLPQAEFAFNDLVNRSTGRSPFQIVYGQSPRGVLELKGLP